MSETEAVERWRAEAALALRQLAVWVERGEDVSIEQSQAIDERRRVYDIRTVVKVADMAYMRAPRPTPQAPATGTEAQG